MKKVPVSPILKWVGGKRQLLSEINSILPEDVLNGEYSYYEPFVGGGAVLFYLQPEFAVLNDTNEELVNLYLTIKNKPDELIADLQKHKNEEEYFYCVRQLDRDIDIYAELSSVERASRILYLNKTCYNGLFRVNQSGQFNAPFGRYKNPDLVCEEKIFALSRYFNNNNVQIMNKDFEEAVSGAGPGAFVYFDPPYDPVSASSNFTAYASGGFNHTEQVRLKECCDRLNASGVKFLLSNSATPFIRDLYKNYHVTIIKAKRNVNSKAELRGEVEEVLVRNYL